MIFVLVAVLLIIAIVLFIRFLRFKQIVRLFEDYSVCVFGARGSGKDMLMANVVAYRNKPYIANQPYTKNNKNYYPFNPLTLNLGGNKFTNFADGKIIKYEYPYPDGIDYYISDSGVYYPSQYCGILNARYDEVPLAQALLRHNADANFHWNCQNLNRVWDKIREMGEVYILCRFCRVRKIFGKIYVTQRIRVYDRYQSALDKVEPLVLSSPFFGKDLRQKVKIEEQRFKAKYGNVNDYKIGYFMRAKYNTRFFKEVLKNGQEKVNQNGQARLNH